MPPRPPRRGDEASVDGDGGAMAPAALASVEARRGSVRDCKTTRAAGRAPWSRHPERIPGYRSSPPLPGASDGKWHGNHAGRAAPRRRRCRSSATLRRRAWAWLWRTAEVARVLGLDRRVRRRHRRRRRGPRRSPSTSPTGASRAQRSRRRAQTRARSDRPSSNPRPSARAARAPRARRRTARVRARVATTAREAVRRGGVVVARLRRRRRLVRR